MAVFGVALLALLALGGAWRLRERRPRYVFVNETAHHTHDLALKMSLKLAEQRSGAENALVLLASLPPGTSIEAAAVQLFQRWQVGRARQGKGVLYVYSEQENLFKIEVGYALEGLLPDATCHRLEAAAQSYMLSEMPQDFLSELLITLNLAVAEGRRLGEDEVPPAPPGLLATAVFLSGGAGVRARGYEPAIADIQRAVARLPAARAGAFTPGATPAETVERYLAALAEGFGDPRLALLTEGSRVFRLVLPRSLPYQRRVVSDYGRGLPYRIVVGDDLAYVLFRPGTPNLPLVLRRAEDRLWYVDEPKSWTYFHRFENGVDPYPAYDDVPLLAALRAAGMPHAGAPVFVGRVATPAPLAHPRGLAQALAEVDAELRRAPRDARLHARAGELYLFEAGWLSRATTEFAAAARLAPATPSYHWRLYDLYLQSSRVEEALTELHTLAAQLPSDRELQRWRAYYDAQYAFAPGDFD